MFVITKAGERGVYGYDAETSGTNVLYLGTEEEWGELEVGCVYCQDEAGQVFEVVD